MSRARAFALGGLVLAALVLLAAVGRWERSRAGDQVAAEILRVRADLGPRLASPRLTSYYRTDGLTCLLYDHGRNPYALGLCFDGQGRLIEAVDARFGTPEYASVRGDPSLAPLVVPPGRVAAVLAYLRNRHAVLYATTTAWGAALACYSAAASVERGTGQPLQARETCGEAAATVAVLVARVRPRAPDAAALLDETRSAVVQTARAAGAARSRLRAALGTLAAAKRDVDAQRRVYEIPPLPPLP